MSTCPTCKTTYPDTMRLCPTDGTVLEGGQAPKDENIGRTLDGKYRLDKRLSSGGMGTVYKATHLMLGKSVAVKLIKADLPASPEVVRRFQREAKAASALNHPNIAPAYDLGQTQDGTLYIAMEYIDGPNLKEAIQAGPIPPARTINLLKQVASALSLAHKHEIIHRDLKPQNIMLTKDADGREVAKLLDFGIAKTLDDSATQLTATGFSLGTPQYMSPEQAYGRPVDGRSDLYSLGIILYEMLVGEVPFSDPSTPAVLVKQMTEAPVPPALKRPDLQISPELAAIALKCLEKDPTKRYQTADEFSAALDSAAAALGATLLPLPGQTAAGTATAAATVVIGQPAYAQTTQLPTPAPVPTPSAASQTTAVAPTPSPTGATTKIGTKPVAQPAAAAPVAPPVEPPKPAPAPVPAPAAASAASAATSKPTGGGGSRVAVAAVIVILLLGGGAYAAYQMGFLKLPGSKDAAGTSAAATSPAPATQLATAAPPSPAPAATPDPNAAAAGAASASGSSGAASTSGAASPTSGGGSGNPPSGGASSAAPPAPPAAPPSAPPSNPPSAGAPTMGAAGKTSTHAANTAAAPATVTTTPIKAATPGASASGQPTPAASNLSTSASSSGATSKPTTQSGAQAPAAAPAAAALPANPSVAFRCDGPPDICGALKSAMDQSLSKDSMPSIRDAARADVALVGTVTFVDEQTQKMFGQSFTIRNYTIDVSGEAKRGGESVPMPSAATLNYDARYRDRLDEKARLVAASVVENIREFWKKK